MGDILKMKAKLAWRIALFAVDVVKGLHKLYIATRNEREAKEGKK